MSTWVESAISEVVGVLMADGFDVGSWKVLAQSNRLVVELRPCGWIAKICRMEALERMGSASSRLLLISSPTEAYGALRLSLDSFQGELPDFSDAIVGASRLARESALSCLTNEEATLLRSALASGVSSLSEFRWNPRTLHGDPHTGNVVLTPSGPRRTPASTSA